jgi:Na+-transporting methylmalonyl-CoA/oxaloacetate decarboxylase gamma subunit
MMESVLGFCALVLTMLMLLGLVVWFCCSIAENIMKMRRQLKNSKYSTLLRENERLKGLLAVVAKENPHLRARLRRAYHSERTRRGSSVRQPAA